MAKRLHLIHRERLDASDWALSLTVAPTPVLYRHCSPGWFMSGRVPIRRIHLSGSCGLIGVRRPTD
ncbi:MAG: hypothetical protein QOJ93_2164 [Actinomycetota bacterium]|nr:hypothetical protein [Actinomycetota bacterium]